MLRTFFMITKRWKHKKNNKKQKRIKKRTKIYKHRLTFSKTREL